MSKHLPYFQFEPAEWLTGDISMCSMEAQGLFVNIKCIYWQKDCKLTLSQVEKRFKDYPELIKELIDEDVLKVKDGNVVIEFLDEQRTALLRRKQRLSKAGSKGAKQRIKNQQDNKGGSNDDDATPKQLEEKRIEDNTNTPEKSGADVGDKNSKNIDWTKLLNLFNETFGKKSRVVNETVKRSFRARLKDYSRDDIVTVMNRIKNDKFHQDNNFKHVDLEYIARPKTMDKYISMADEPEGKGVALNMNT